VVKVELSEAETIVQKLEQTQARAAESARRTRAYRAKGYHTLGYKPRTDWDAFYVSLFAESMLSIGEAAGLPGRDIAHVLGDPPDFNPQSVFGVVYPPIGRPVTPTSARKYW